MDEQASNDRPTRTHGKKTMTRAQTKTFYTQYPVLLSIFILNPLVLFLLLVILSTKREAGRAFRSAPHFLLFVEPLQNLCYILQSDNMVTSASEKAKRGAIRPCRPPAADKSVCDIQ